MNTSWRRKVQQIVASRIEVFDASGAGKSRT